MVIKSAEFEISAVKVDGCPIPNLGEVMFCGRSNVGKSSFINMLVNRKSLARTSSNPGKTQTLNIFLINEEFYFVDVPGYGYANVSKSIKASFAKMIETYIKKREELKMAFLLLDYRHKPTADDISMYQFLKYYGVPTTIILTKADKLSNNEKAKNKKMIIEAIDKAPEDEVIETSVLKKIGIKDTLDVIERVVKE